MTEWIGASTNIATSLKNVFARLKHSRAIATRYDKLKRNFESIVALACAFIW
jgi:transposase